MRKKLLWLAVPVILLICVLVFIQLQYPRKTFDDLLGVDEAKITKVLMRSGVTGKGVETSDSDKIKELISILDNRHYRKAFNQELRTGYIYAYTFYSKSNEILRIVGCGNNVHIYTYSEEKSSGKYYNVSKEIPLHLLDIWFNSLSRKGR